MNWSKLMLYRSGVTDTGLVFFIFWGKGAGLNCGYLKSKIFGWIHIGQRSQQQKSASFIKGPLI